jgi:nicotinamidase-related amidase
MSKLLVVVDMQNDFIDGALGTKEAQSIVPNVVKKVEECRKNGYDVFFTKDTHFFNYMKTEEGKNLPV